MHQFWKFVHCAMSGHPMSISYLETINGQLYATHETCCCGRKSNLQFPGAAIKAFHEAYSDCPTEYQDFF